MTQAERFRALHRGPGAFVIPKENGSFAYLERTLPTPELNAFMET